MKISETVQKKWVIIACIVAALVVSGIIVSQLCCSDKKEELLPKQRITRPIKQGKKPINFQIESVR